MILNLKISKRYLSIINQPAIKFACLLIMIAMLHAPISLSAQTVTYSGNNVRLPEIFKVIKEQTGVVFFYDAALLKDAKPVTIKWKNKPLGSALNELFKNQPLTWVLEDKTATLVKKPVPIDSLPGLVPQA